VFVHFVEQYISKHIIIRVKLTTLGKRSAVTNIQEFHHIVKVINFDSFTYSFIINFMYQLNIMEVKHKDLKLSSNFWMAFKMIEFQV